MPKRHLCYHSALLTHIKAGSLIMMRTHVSTDTNTIAISRSKRAVHPQSSHSIPAFFPLLSQDRKAAFVNAAQVFKDYQKSPVSVVIVSDNTIYAANVGNVAVYLAVKNKQNELIYFHEINNPLYDLVEVDSAMEAEAKSEAKVDSSDKNARVIIDEDATTLRDTHGNIIGETSQLSLLPSITTTELRLPLGAEAFVLHDPSGLVRQLSCSQMKAILNDHSLLAGNLETLVEHIPARKKAEAELFVMMTPMQKNQFPKYLFYADYQEMPSFLSRFQCEMQIKLDGSLAERRRFENKLLVVQHNRYLLEELGRQLVSISPKYAAYRRQVVSLLGDLRFFRQEKKEFDSGAFNEAINKLLFVEVYKESHRSTRFLKLRSSAPSDPIARCLEDILINRFPEIERIDMPKEINHSNIRNKILWVAGERYPELVVMTRNALDHIHEQNLAPQEKKKHYTNTAKALVRLGPQGLAESLRLFKPRDGEFKVKKATIKKFYADHVEAVPRPR
jgi:hypothetical protein